MSIFSFLFGAAKAEPLSSTLGTFQPHPVDTAYNIVQSLLPLTTYPTYAHQKLEEIAIDVLCEHLERAL